MARATFGGREACGKEVGGHLGEKQGHLTTAGGMGVLVLDSSITLPEEEIPKMSPGSSGQAGLLQHYRGPPHRRARARGSAPLVPLGRQRLLGLLRARLRPRELLDDYVLGACRGGKGDGGLETPSRSVLFLIQAKWSLPRFPARSPAPLGSSPLPHRPVLRRSLPPQSPNAKVPLSPGGEIRTRGGMDGRDRKKREGSRGEGVGESKKNRVRFREEQRVEGGWKALSCDMKLNRTSSPYTCRKQQSREAL